MTSIFLSHSSKDNRAAEALKDWLQANGHAVLLDFDPDSGINSSLTHLYRS